MGFPGHWLSEFLNEIVQDNLVSTATPNLGTLPAPLSEAKRVVPARKLFLDPWKLDWENILSAAYEVLLFPIHIPRFSKKQNRDIDEVSICSSDEIGCYQAKLAHKHWSFYTTLPGMRMNTDPCFALFFLRPGIPYSADHLAAKIANVIDGQVTKAGDFYVLTVVDELSIESGKIGWRMRKTRVEKMKQEKWTMIPVRFDAREAGSFFSSSKWGK